MPAQDRRYLISLMVGEPGDDATLTAIRSALFDWLKEAGAEVVEDGGANRVVIAAAPETAEQVGDLAYVRTVEPYA
ncbi:hypothetical protein [Nocardia arthritidis]|uniref:hypothetical protein n=1 Tax=Nocardia arthritidis TaxID=228602 RepID=UPI0007A52C81|nr:hypothetical protein [Nocardia arthritidis]